MTKETPAFKITYCATCGFKSRAEELRSEIEKAFSQESELVEDCGGLFEVEYGDELVFSKKFEERFPEVGEVVNIVSALKKGKTLAEAQQFGKESIPSSPTFEDWYKKELGNK